jgi:regulation of enolase protein 1 (concanavalin A-like superfamily)
MWERGVWLNEPRQWSAQGGSLRLTTDDQTDFWRETHYGFTHDNGHFLGLETPGDFSASLRVGGIFEALYDQAGMMVRIDDANWVKFGVERWKGRTVFSSVLTLGRSDWAVGSEMRTESFHVRATVRNRALKLDVSEDGEHWSLLRIAPFPAAQTYLVGATACTPTRAGLAVTFDSFLSGPAKAER